MLQIKTLAALIAIAISSQAYAGPTNGVFRAGSSGAITVPTATSTEVSVNSASINLYNGGLTRHTAVIDWSKFQVAGNESVKYTNNTPAAQNLHLLNVDNGGQPQQMALHQAVVMTYKGPSPAQLAAVSAAAAAPSTSIGAPMGGMPQNLTPEQVEAFRQQMRDRFSKSGPGGASDGRSRGPDVGTSSKSNKNAVPAAPTNSSKTPKTPKVR